VSTAVRVEAYSGEALTWISREGLTNPCEDLAAPAVSYRRPGEVARILVADDNADMREHLSHILAPRYELTTAADGLAALEAARRNRPDLILSDVMMPGLDGYSLLRELRADEQLREIPVILLSARAGEEARTEGIAAGADDYLTKPFNARELTARVRTALDLHRLRRSAREELARSEERYRSIVNQSVAGIAEVLPDGTFIMVNDQYCRITGYSREELFSRRMQDLTHPDDLPRNLELFRRAVERHEGFEIHKRYVRSDGSDVWVHNSVSPVADAGGTIRSIVAIVVDVTLHKRAEEALRESEQRFRNMADSAPVIVWMTERDGTCTYLNRRWYEFTGQSEEASLGFGWLDAVHPEDRAESDRIFREASARHEAFRLEYRLRRLDGVYRWAIDAAAPRFGAEGEFLGYVGSVLDITDRRLVEEELRRTNADLEQFAYSASHDLQEPLRSIKIYSELLASRHAAKLDGQALQYLEFLRSGATRMELLVRDLLAYTQAARSDKPASLIDSGESLNGALANLSEAVAESGARITWEPLPRVRVHPTQLQQVFQNLLGNAIKYRSPDRTPAVHVGVTPGEDLWRFSVADNGIGIAPEYKERIFGLFKRLHTAREYPGTGIGLAICQRIVEHYHGRIWVESEPGTGSTFFFTIPA
jgi:PAS domain S-box-containing protein